MKVLVVGKSHRAGTSKLGKNYNFTTLMIEYSMRANDDNDGVQVDRINVDAGMMSYAAFVVGSEYFLDFDCNGYLHEIKKV